MKARLLLLPFALAVSAPASPASRFYDQLTPEQRRAAGVESLTEEQRAALSVLADRWVEAKAEPAISAARAEAAAQVRAEAKEEARKRAGFAPPEPAAADVIRTRVAGTFRGWGKGTIFRLENGQTWAVSDNSAEPRYFPPREKPEVEIRPAIMGTWKFYIMPDGLWVRVKRIQ
jgi:hypothetical protein